MNVIQVPSQWVLRERVSACRFLSLRDVVETLLIFSAEVAKKFSVDVQAGIFKYMALHAFRLILSPTKIAAVCVGLDRISRLDANCMETMIEDIAFGRSGINEIDRRLSECYKIYEPLFPKTDKEVWFGDVAMVADLSTDLITGPEPIKPNNAGLEAFQVGM